MKASIFGGIALLALTFTGVSNAQAKIETQYQKFDTYSVSRNTSTNNMIEINLGGAKNGAVDEVLGYFLKAKIPRALIEGDLIFKGSKDLRISIERLGIFMMLESDEYFAASVNDSKLYQKEALGLANVVSFGGTQAKYLMGVMEKAGVTKVPFKGNAESFTLSGDLVTCRYSKGVMEHVCELTMPINPSKY